MSKKRKKNRYIKAQDSISPSGAGSSMDRGRGYSPESNPYNAGFGNLNNRQYRGSGRFYHDTMFFELWRDYWEAKKIVNILPYDMTREGWTYDNQDIDPEKIEAVEKEATRIKLIQTVFKALVMERLYGGSAILIGTKEISADGNEQTPKKPLNVEGIGKGDLVFLRAIPRRLLSATDIETDPFSPNYLRPKEYAIANHEVHRSRLLIFDGGGDPGEGLSMGSQYRYRDGFGFSVLQDLHKDIFRADGTRQAAFHLLHMASLLLFKKSGKKGIAMPGTQAGNLNKDKLDRILEEISIYKAAILSGDDDVVQTTNSSAQGIAVLIETYLQVLSAASDIPAPRFLGEAPGGLNATGKGDLINYYDSVHSRQEIHLKPELQRLIPILSASALGERIPLEIKFKPLLQLTEDLRADLRTKDLANIEKAVDLGVGNETWAVAEALDREIFMNDPKDYETFEEILNEPTVIQDACGGSENLGKSPKDGSL